MYDPNYQKNAESTRNFFLDLLEKSKEIHQPRIG